MKLAKNRKETGQDSFSSDDVTSSGGCIPSLAIYRKFHLMPTLVASVTATSAEQEKKSLAGAAKWAIVRQKVLVQPSKTYGNIPLPKLPSFSNALATSTMKKDKKKTTADMTGVSHCLSPSVGTLCLTMPFSPPRACF